ncbi:hypothetical protein OD350_28700 (plasmid) [Clostridium beijerinckii]|uniref:hypothetical protein n=1 Tax=Clostridium beijerinckii TaxID=1520 RepID=UPI0022261872|nr:hypothetical protein [Clostridium beijerinckii]UYZ39054.1 hypothetical protein OD350_28700 [Clostridium beijerinckii]
MKKEPENIKKQPNNMQPQKNYKRFPLDSRVKFMKYLNRLICQVYRQLDKYKRYEKELEEIIYSHTEFNDDGTIKSGSNISAYEYESIYDKLRMASMELVKIVGDNTNDSASYYKYRRMLEKNTIDVPFDALSDEIKAYLTDINDLRNWMFHNPESLYVSEEEYTRASIPENMRPYTTMSYRSSPIIITYVEEYRMNMAVSLMIHSQRRIEMFEKIYENMIHDYEKILGQKLDIQLKKDPPMSLGDAATDIIQLSYAIQKKKYKGREEDIKKLWDLKI